MIFVVIHIDGAKDTYKQDFLNIKPLLKNNAFVIFDDSQIPDVQRLVDTFISEGYLCRSPEFQHMNPKIKYRNEILINNIMRTLCIYDFDKNYIELLEPGRNY